ncbi:hypothetical protein AAVH_17759 [Aphelenchoides avenae]|nr:hypothetical protein AAVH_17759 [Aphelenchus avenae]
MQQVVCKVRQVVGKVRKVVRKMRKVVRKIRKVVRKIRKVVRKIRKVVSQLEEFHAAFSQKGLHKYIFVAIRNLSRAAESTAEKAIASLEQRDDAYFNKFRFLVQRPYKIGVSPHRRIDEHFRWSEKDRGDAGARREPWFDESASDGCMQELFLEGCPLSESCLKTMLGPKGTTGYIVTHQVLYVSIGKMAGCSAQIETFLNSSRGAQTTEDYVAELCTNIHDEVARYQRDKRKLARISHDDLDLLVEQVFVCGQFGFVDFANPHVLVAALAWQHPRLGCYTRSKPEALPNMGLSADVLGFGPGSSARKPLEESVAQDSCLSHMSTVAAGALLTFLRLLLDPAPWPEFHFADQLVQIDAVVAEDRFVQFRYIDWVRDALLPSDVRLPRPPPVAWSPDLIAFVVLLFIFVAGVVVAHHLFSSSATNTIGRKRVYHYAYKKL